MTKQKNVLLIFTDQQRFDTIEAHGNPVIKTPVLNRLSQSGVHFNRSAPDRKEWLFNHRTDPEETRNLALNPLYIKKASQLRQKLIDYYRQVGYFVPLDGDNWKTHPIRTMPDDQDAFLLFQDAGEVPELEGYSTDANSKIYFTNSWYE